MNKAVASGIRAGTSAHNTSTGTEVDILEGVGDDEGPISLEATVDGLDAGGVVRLEELVLNVVLFVPDAHVGGTVEVGEGGLVTGSVVE